MTREELQHDFHNEQGINWLNSQGEPDIDYVMWLENKILAIKNNTPLPPAEGAELDHSLDHQHDHLLDHPEGAEEFLLAQRNGNDNPITVAISPEGWVFKMIVRTMEKFATLHARKMARENLREELIAYDKWLNRTRWGMREVLSPEKAVERYLKSKEQ